MYECLYYTPPLPTQLHYEQLVYSRYVYNYTPPFLCFVGYIQNHTSVDDLMHHCTCLQFTLILINGI